MVCSSELNLHDREEGDVVVGWSVMGVVVSLTSSRFIGRDWRSHCFVVDGDS